MSDCFDDFIGYFIGFISVFCGWFFGSFDGSLKVLIVLVILDYITGITGAARHGELSSSKGFWGILNKVFIFSIVGIAHVIGNELLDHTIVVREAVIYFYAANEGFSIIENADKLGIPIPKIIRNMFTMLKVKISGDNLPLDVPTKKEHPPRKNNSK